MMKRQEAKDEKAGNKRRKGRKQKTKRQETKDEKAGNKRRKDRRQKTERQETKDEKAESTCHYSPLTAPKSCNGKATLPLSDAKTTLSLLHAQLVEVATAVA